MTRDEASLIVRLYNAVCEEGLTADHCGSEPGDDSVLRDAWNIMRDHYHPYTPECFQDQEQQ